MKISHGLIRVARKRKGASLFLFRCVFSSALLNDDLTPLTLILLLGKFMILITAGNIFIVNWRHSFFFTSSFGISVPPHISFTVSLAQWTRYDNLRKFIYNN